MRRVICLLCLLLCLPVLAGSAPEPPAETAPEERTAAFAMDAAPREKIDATSVIMIERDSGEVLYERGADERIYPASTTKVMTALCVVNAVDDLDGTEVTVHQQVLNQLPDDKISMAGLVDGEQLTVRQLLYCLLLPSGNDAAVVLADYVGGSIGSFVELMNATAVDLGCENTHFASVNGLSGEEHYSTARDMARIAEELLQNEDLAQVVRTPSYLLTTNVHTEMPLENTNHMLDVEDEFYHPAVTGVKTGSATLSGRCFISSAEQDGLRLLCVIMGAPYLDDRGEAIKPNPAIAEAYDLYDWAFSSFSRVTLTDAEPEVRVNVKGAGSAMAHPAWKLSAVLPADRAGEIGHTITTQEPLSAPLEEGQTVGEVVFTCGDEQLGTVPLVLDEAVPATRWWMWPLPIAIGAVVLSVVLRLALRRRTKAAAVTQSADYSPFVDYGDQE